MIKALLFLLCLTQAYAFNEVANGDEIRQRLGMFLDSNVDLSNVKVAVLDNGFVGYVPGKGMLPSHTELIEAPLKIPDMSSHGLGMAQILWEASGKSEKGPKFYLLNSNGFTNFKAAVDFVIQNKIDIVLYSQIWTFGSNFDGKGFINQVVNRALDKGVIWINAAGNLGSRVYNGRVLNDSRFIQVNNKLDENSFSLTLSWNDFSDSEEICSTKDLNLELYNSHKNLVASSELIQMGQNPEVKNSKDKRSCYAREAFNLKNLDRGVYTLKIIQKSSNFTDSDTFRIIITEDRPGTVEFVGISAGAEIMPPADNSRVLTVGEKTLMSAMGPTSDGRIKPDVLIEKAVVSFTNGNQTAGTSNAAAMVAGVVSVLKARKADFNSEMLLNYTRKLRTVISIPPHLQELKNPPQWLLSLIPNHGILRQDPGTYRAVILSKEEPTLLPMLRRFNLRKVRSSDIIACHRSMSYCHVYPIEQDYGVKPPMIEFRQFDKVPSDSTPALWVTPKI